MNTSNGKSLKIFVIIVIICVLNHLTMSQKPYFQQEVNYKINVKLNDKKHSLNAFETIEYINNSPDTLYYIYFHLWPNAYKNNSTALAIQQLGYYKKKGYYADDQERGYIDSLQFKINGKIAYFKKDEKHIDIGKLVLNDPLPPGSKISISTPFYVKIPDCGISRLGHHGESYQITQWYPKPAVYDKYGWHQMPYLDIGEFYSEFGAYEVSITLPDNYIVGATGNLQEKSEIMMLDSISNATKAIKKFNRNDLNFPPSSKNWKTITYKENNIHDFAWFADKRFNVLKSQVKLPNNGNIVNTYVYFTNYEANIWKEAARYVNDALYYYSKWYGDYPYKNCSAVEAASCEGGGMEYPTITVIGYSGDSLTLEEVIMHEVGHNWFFGVLASNERDNPWMDEGINSFSELRYMNTKYPDLTLFDTFDMPEGMAKYLEIYNCPYQSKYEIPYLINARRNLDQPCNLKSEDFLAMNYFTIAYMKSAFIFNYLKEYLGDKEFDDIMQYYYKTWKFKHPSPEDFINIFKTRSSKKLDWFFDDLLTSSRKIDYKIGRVKKTDSSGYKVTLKNKGRINIPVPVSIIKNGTEKEYYFIEPHSNKTEFKIKTTDFDYICIDDHHIFPDIRKRNNYYYNKGVFKKWKPIDIQLLGAYENPQKTQLFYIPAIDWNNNNGFMTGVALYNYLLPMKKLEFSLVPLYGWKNKNIAGQIAIDYHILTDKTFQRIDISASARQFAFNENYNFQRYCVNADFWLKTKKFGQKIEDHIYISSIGVPLITEMLYYNQYNNKVYLLAEYLHQNKRVLNPFDYQFIAEGNSEYAKAWFTGNYKLNYSHIKKGLDIRFFAGAFLFNNLNDASVNFRLSGWAGNQDYTYSNYFIDRTSRPGSGGVYQLYDNQFVINDGGFKSYTGLGQTDQWITTLCLETDIPLPLPVRIFAGIGTYDHIQNANPSEIAVYEGGISIRVIKNIFEIYFPIVVSQNIKTNHDYIYDNNLQKIRFTLNLNRLDIINIVRNFSL